MPKKATTRTKSPASASPFRNEDEKARKQRVQKINRILDRTFPDATLALNYSTSLELLMALILAAQCTDERVNQVTASLFKKYQSAQDWTQLDRGTLEAEIRPTGFYRNKAKTIQACCQELAERYGGEVPDKLEDLVSLPGVGRKTANILLGNAFGQEAIGVDTHVGRLAQRLGFTHETNPDKIEFDLNPIVPNRMKVRFCHLLQEHGRAICTARKPDCPHCPINHLCPYPIENKISLSPEQQKP